MKVSVVRPGDLGPAELGVWRALQRSTPELENAFLSHEFALAAGRVRPATRVAVIEDGQEIVGFFPFEEARARVGRQIAPGISDAQAVIHPRPLEFDARDLLKGCRLDVWEFDHLIEPQLGMAGARVVLRGSPVIDVSAGYAAYVADRQRNSKKIFKSTLYKRRKLERDIGGVRFELDVRDPEPLETLMSWKTAQYRRTGRRDRFAVGWIRQLVTDLFEARAAECAGTLSALYADGRLVAAHFGLRCNSQLSCWFPAYDVSLARYSPGLALHLHIAEDAAAAGVRRLDLGKGDEDYKQSLKTSDAMVGEGFVDRPSAVALARRAQRAPRRLATEIVRSSPPLRRAARRVIKQVAGLRSSS